METLTNKSKNITLFFGVLVAILIGSVIPAKADGHSTPKKVSKWSNSEIAIENYQLLKDYVQKLEKVEAETNTVVIYDTNDNLLIECTMDTEKEIKAVNTILKNCDLLMDYDGTSYYRVSE